MRSRAALLIPAAAAVLIVALPLVALIASAEWTGLPTRLTSPLVWPAIRLSLVTSTVAVGISLVLGTPLAWLLARSQSRYAGWFRALVTIPLVLPPVVGGVALLLAYGRRGLVGAPVLSLLGWQVPFTPVAVVLSQVFVSLPFLVIAAEGAMRTIDARFDAVAATLGASPWRTFTRVALPLALPGLAAGSALAWARAFGEFGATITFAGNVTGRTQTAPLAVYVALQDDPQTAVALSLVMLLISGTVLIVMRRRWVL